MRDLKCSGSVTRPGPPGKAPGAGNTDGRHAAIATRLNAGTNETARCDSFRPTLTALVRHVLEAGPDRVAAALAEVAPQAAALVTAGRVTSTAILTFLLAACAARHMSQGAAEAQLLAAQRDRRLP
jgi:hypothetical protein